MFRAFGLCGALSFAVVPFAEADVYDAPAGYYSSATGTGSVLKSQLTSILTSGHIQRSYGDFRFSAALHDRDPNNANNILLVYDRSSVNGTWNTSPLIWNREHVWPVSRQPGSASNGSTGNVGDPHALRPADPGINSNRGNDPFGFAATTGSYGPVGSSWYPGDTDRGDIARSLFYSATRYASTLTLVNGTPGSNQMGDLASLVAWHYLDVPDDFERRRNHVIYSQAENPSYYTNNRSAYVDRPEFVHSVFVDNLNDTKLTLAGATPAADGGTTLDLDFGRVIVGAALPTAQNVTLNKAGSDGTYYEVSTSSPEVTSSVAGRYNAFAVGGSGSQNLTIGISGSTATSGVLGGDVVIDNLDVTDGLGSGFGSKDADDVISAHLTVLDHSNAAFLIGGDANSQTIDFGTITQGASVADVNSAIINLASADFGAGLDLDSIFAAGDTGVFSNDLVPFGALDGGDFVPFSVSVDTTNVGTFSATYALQTSDEDLPGAAAGDVLSLTVMAEIVAAGFIDGDYNGDGFVSQPDLDLVLLNWGDSSVPAGWAAADQFDGVQISQNELDGVLLNWGDGTPPSVSAIPEPGSLLLGVVPGIWLARRTRRGV